MLGGKRTGSRHVADSLLPEHSESPEPPPPPSFNPKRIKSSSRFDDQSSPPGISSSKEKHVEFQPLNVPTHQLDVKFKKEERDELQLDFLDILEDTDYVPVNDCERSVKIISINKLRQNATDPAPPTLGIMEKRKLAVERVKAVLYLKHRRASKIPETEFLVVDTIRKLPSSVSLLNRASFENPSPLCNNFNVNYKFNSTTKSNIDLSKWGLEAMPEETTKLLQLTGIDVTRLMELKRNSKMSMHKLRLQQEAHKAATKTEDECISSGLFRSLSTQTDARNFTKSVAVQTKAISQHGIFWLDSQFSESDLSQQHANVINNVIGKMVLNEFPFPLTVTLVQLCSITLYSGPFFNLWRIRKYQDIPRSYYMRLIVPLAIGKLLASVTSHISLWKVPVSYAHTVKATMPLFTVVLTRLFFGEKQPTLVYLSLLPIITGVAIATVTEISFDMLGLISALISTMGFSMQNIFSKKVLKDTGIHHLRLLHLLGKLSLLIFLPLWLYMDSLAVLRHSAIKNLDYRVIALLFTDGVLNWMQNIIAFSVLSLVTPLTYAVASASKRIFVIAVSLLILGNPVTWVNCLGMTLAIIGVLCYNRAKQISKNRTELPTVSHSNHVKYTPLQHNDSYYRSPKNGNLPNGLHKMHTTTGTGTGTTVNMPMSMPMSSKSNSLLANGSGMPTGSSTRLLFV
ncbi:hypothetical protein ACLKA6_013049 [Drosophila palustris]